MPNDSLLFMLELIYYASLITKVKQRNSVSKVRQRQFMRVVSGWDICSRPGRVPDGGGLRGQGGLETGCGDMVWSSLYTRHCMSFNVGSSIRPVTASFSTDWNQPIVFPPWKSPPSLWKPRS